MFTSGQQQKQDMQDLQERVARLETGLDQVRRQIESVGRQVGETPLSANNEHWHEQQARLDDLQTALTAMEARLQAPPPPAPVVVAPSVPLDLPAWAAPEPEPPRPEPEPVTAESLEEELAETTLRIYDAVPIPLQSMLEATRSAVLTLVHDSGLSRQASDGYIELTLRVAVDGDLASNLQEAFERERETLLATLAGAAEDHGAQVQTFIERDVPALVDVCDTGRRQYDATQPFYRRIEPWLRHLLSLCELEAIEPTHGQAYNPAEHNALDLVETDTDTLKDHIESCRYRGYRRHGELLKKAGVVIYR